MAATDIEIGSPTIRLGQLLKLGGLVASGGEARAVLATGEVTVNGAVEVRRGRQVRSGDIVVLRATRVRVVDRQGGARARSPSAGTGRCGASPRSAPDSAR